MNRNLVKGKTAALREREVPLLCLTPREPQERLRQSSFKSLRSRKVRLSAGVIPARKDPRAEPALRHLAPSRAATWLWPVARRGFGYRRTCLLREAAQMIEYTNFT